MFNQVILVGNLTRDIELRYTSGGTALAKTAIATTRKFSNNGEKKEEVCFVDITFFGRSAEIANQYLRKGSKCLIQGRLMFEQWNDQQGQKRSKHSITVETMQMLDSKQDSSYQAPSAGYSPNDPNAYDNSMKPSFGQQGYQTPPAQTPYQGQKMPYTPQQSIPDVVDDEEIPF